jgi:hypothetical protein
MARFRRLIWRWRLRETESRIQNSRSQKADGLILAAHLFNQLSTINEYKNTVDFGHHLAIGV